MVRQKGSSRRVPQGATPDGALDDDAPVTITVYLKAGRARRRPGSAGDLRSLMRAGVTREELAARRSLQFADAVTAFRNFAATSGLRVDQVNPAHGSLKLTGSAREMGALFRAKLRYYRKGGHRFVARTGALHVPAVLAPWTRALLGFDRRPLAQHRLTSMAGIAPGTGLPPGAVAASYGVPKDQGGAGQCVGIIALGGGYRLSDLAAAAALDGHAAPNVIDVSVGGAVNDFGDNPAADEELALDLQVIAGIVPAARIVVYFTTNNQQGLADALHAAVFDDANKPQVLSLSWASAESYWTKPARDAVQSALADAVRLKVSVTAASGDFLATAGVTDGKAHVSFPASSPYVLGCGGTAPSADNAAVDAAWNAAPIGTGGGISDVFEVPDYQSKASLPAPFNGGAAGRGVPDVAGAAGAEPGYRIMLGGSAIAKDGTSAVAPLWAAIIALANARRQRPLGLVNPFLYANPGLCRGIVLGDNRVNGIGYDAGRGWNACTGLGVPNGAALITALAAADL